MVAAPTTAMFMIVINMSTIRSEWRPIIIIAAANIVNPIVIVVVIIGINLASPPSLLCREDYLLYVYDGEEGEGGRFRRACHSFPQCAGTEV